MSQAEPQPEALLGVGPVQAVWEQHNELLGVAAEQGANLLSITRGVGAVALNRYIANNENYQSWKTVGAFTLLALTDMEGKLARWGRKLRGKDEKELRPFQSYLDHLTDKLLIDGTMTAIAQRETQSGNVIYGKVVGAVAGTTIARDVATTGDRIVADFQGIDTRAQSSGKIKAVKQFVATGFALSPLARSKAGKAVAGLGFMYTAGESVKSGWQLHKSFSEKRRLRNKD